MSIQSDEQVKCPKCSKPPVAKHYAWDWSPLYICNPCGSFFGDSRDNKEKVEPEKVKAVRKKKAKIDNNPKLVKVR